MRCSKLTLFCIYNQHTDYMHNYAASLISAIALMGCAACGGSAASSQAKASEPAAAPQKALAFNADSAYAYVAAQTAFGPRVPGTEASARCAEWLQNTLERFGASNISLQNANVTAYDGTRLPITNISAQWKPEAKARVMLLAHYDSRPWADQEENADDREKPIDGANDGASGVGVILEIVRNLQANNPEAGVDVLFVDAEDYGRRADQPQAADDDSWCLGTQYWLQHPTLDISAIRYAVLLDMVGAPGAKFPREMHSQYMAPKINDKAWRAARMAGTTDRFPDKTGGAIIDDHVYLLRAGIPAIDIIESANDATGSFHPAWHTHADNIDNIDPATLQAVGLTVTQMIINEK